METLEVMNALVKLGKFSFNRKLKVFEYEPFDRHLFGLTPKESLWANKMDDLLLGAWEALSIAEGEGEYKIKEEEEG